MARLLENEFPVAAQDRLPIYYGQEQNLRRRYFSLIPVFANAEIFKEDRGVFCENIFHDIM